MWGPRVPNGNNESNNRASKVKSQEIKSSPSLKLQIGHLDCIVCTSLKNKNLEDAISNQGQCGKMKNMTKQLKEILERVDSWPEKVQQEAVQTLLTIEERGTGTYHVSDEEWVDMQEGLAQAQRGEFVSDEEVAKANKKLGL